MRQRSLHSNQSHLQILEEYEIFAMLKCTEKPCIVEVNGIEVTESAK
jgi:hypothetical protein